jgi:hypothetical protein
LLKKVTYISKVDPRYLAAETSKIISRLVAEKVKKFSQVDQCNLVAAKDK